MLVLIGVVFLVAGIGKGITGMGLPTFSMALLGLMMPPLSAAALILLPSLATNLAQCAGPHWRTLTRRLWPMWLGLALSTVLCPLPDLGSGSKQVRATLGSVLVVYALWGIIRPRLPDLGRHAAWAGAAAGVLSGVLTATAGVFVIPLVPYLQCFRLDREPLIQALGLSFTVATLALSARLGQIGMGAWQFSTATLLDTLAASFIGLWIGTVLRNRLRPAIFQRALYGVFLMLGLTMLYRSL